MNPERLPRYFLFAVLLGFSGCCLALSSDREQPIRIEADSVEIDDLKGISVYRGNVRYVQGTLRLLADTLTLFYDQDRRLERLEADGTPARFRQRPDGREEDMHAEALHIEYLAGPQRLILEHRARIRHQGNEFTGELIEYDAVQDVVSARKGESGEGRVQVVIQPPRDKPGADAAPDGP